MWDEFVYQSLPVRVVLGAGATARLGAEVDRSSIGQQFLSWTSRLLGKPGGWRACS